MPFNHHHRQFLQHLRRGDWVAETDLPDKPLIKRTLLRNGWMERQVTRSIAALRITEAGLIEMKQSTRLYNGINKRG